MPVKGMVTACVCVLFDRPVRVEQLAAALAEFGVLKQTPGGERWEFGGPSVVIPYRRDANGLIAVDVVDRPWPDHMGDPKKEAMLFGAWSMGHFGPFAFPNGLHRAVHNCWSWPEAETVLGRHKTFVRLKTSYVYGLPQGDATKVFPEDYDPVDEVRFLIGATVPLLRLPGALCYWNPNGEILAPPDDVSARLTFADEHAIPPLDLIANVRLFNVDDGWVVMDTCGNSQFDHLGLPSPFPDVEACFHTSKVEPNEVDSFLRNTTLYLLKQGPDVFKDGDTIDGPGNTRWKAYNRPRTLINPPRTSLRFFPEKGPKPAAVLFDANVNPLGG
jgi:hypothetical protein